MSTLTTNPSPGISPRTSFHIQKRPSSSTAYSAPSPSLSSTSTTTTTSKASPRSSWSASKRNPYAPSWGSSAGTNTAVAAFTSRAVREQRPQVESTSANASVIVNAGVGVNASVTAGRVDGQTQPSASVYVDAGTQYSPEGLPPTASKKAVESVRPLRQEEERRAGTELHIAQTARAPQRQLSGSGDRDPQASTGRKRKGEDKDPNSVSPTAEQMPTASSASSSAVSSASQPAPRAPLEPEPRQDPTALQSSAPSTNARNSTTPNPSPNPTDLTPTTPATTTTNTNKRPRPAPGTAKLMPLLYQNCAPKDLGHLVSAMLLELIRLNDRIPLHDNKLTRFHSRAPPGISVSDYLQRLIHHATLSPPILLSMVYYIDRLCQLFPIFTINSLTVHRFLITAATVAAKGLSDAFWTNPTYAKVGGIPVGELATLELEFLDKVQWRIVPKPEVLEEYYRSMVERSEGYAFEGEEEEEGESSRSTSLAEGEAGQLEEIRRANGEAEDEEMGDEPS